MEAEELEKRGRPGLIHHVSDVRWTRGGRKNDVRGRGPTAHPSKNCYEWVLIHETWPVQRVQSKNTISSSDCTTMLLTTLWSSYHECVHGRYTGWSPPPYVIFTSNSRPPDVTHVMNETRPSPFFALFRFHVLYWMQTKEIKWGRSGNEARACLHIQSMYTGYVNKIHYSLSLAPTS